MEILNEEYQSLIKNIKEKIKSSQIVAYRKVNTEIIYLYFELGKIFYNKQEELGRGKSVI